MRRLLLLVLLAVPSHSYSQAIPFEQRGPLVSLTATAVNIAHYNQTEHYNRSGSNSTLWGWSAVPEINLSRHFGMQADLSNSYMRSVYPGQNRLFVAGGPRYSFAPIFRTVPFIFAEGGEINVNAPNSSLKYWEPMATVGFGVHYRLRRGLAFTLVPGEYMGQKEESDGTWTHSFAARAGFTVNFYR